MKRGAFVIIKDGPWKGSRGKIVSILPKQAGRIEIELAEGICITRRPDEVELVDAPADT